MSDYNEFKNWIDKVNQEDTIEINHLIDHKVKTLRRTKHIRWAMVPLTSLVSLVITFALLVNLNDAFYVYALNTPILNTLTKLVNGRQDIISAFDSGYVQLIDQKIIVGDYTLEVDSIISDTRTINVFYKIRYLGELVPEDIDWNEAPLDFFIIEDQDFINGYSVRHYESYRWTEVYLENINSYQPFVIRFTPYGEFSSMFGDLTITVDQTKIIETKIVPIHQTIMVAGQKLILESLEMGAFQSRLTYYTDPANEKILNLITFENFTGGMFTPSEEEASKNYRFDGIPIGQLNHQKTISIELKSAALLDKAFRTVSFDPKTRMFAALPEHLKLVDVVVEGNQFEIMLQTKQSVLYSGLFPESATFVEGTHWSAEGTSENGIQTIHISFELINDQPVTFIVLGGNVVEDLPDAIIVKLPIR